LFGAFAMAKRPIDQIETIWVEYRTDIPNWLALEIGRIAVEWSRLEAHFEEVIRLLMPAEMYIGRIATTGMNIRTRVAVASNLVRGHVLHGLLKQATHDEITSIGADVTDGKNRIDADRNKLVHGLWARVEGRWELIRSSGTRPLDPVGKTARAVLPQREPADPAKIKETRKRIRALNQRLIAFCATLESELPPSPYKSRRQLKQSLPSRAQTSKAP
jgi:hypothetical protein